MAKYIVDWTKTYYASGSVEVEAESMAEAERMIGDRIGDLEGSMQYDANEDYIEATLLSDIK